MTPKRRAGAGDEGWSRPVRPGRRRGAARTSRVRPARWSRWRGPPHAAPTGVATGARGWWRR